MYQVFVTNGWNKRKICPCACIMFESVSILDMGTMNFSFPPSNKTVFQSYNGRKVSKKSVSYDNLIIFGYIFSAYLFQKLKGIQLKEFILF